VHFIQKLLSGHCTHTHTDTGLIALLGPLKWLLTRTGLLCTRWTEPDGNRYWANHICDDEVMMKVNGCNADCDLWFLAFFGSHCRKTIVLHLLLTGNWFTFVFLVIYNSNNDIGNSDMIWILQALGQCIPPPRHVLSVFGSRFGSYPWSDHHKNLITCSSAHCQPSLKISSKSIQKFLCKIANKQRNNDKNITSLMEVTYRWEM